MTARRTVTNPNVEFSCCRHHLSNRLSLVKEDQHTTRARNRRRCLHGALPSAKTFNFLSEQDWDKKQRNELVRPLCHTRLLCGFVRPCRTCPLQRPNQLNRTSPRCVEDGALLTSQFVEQVTLRVRSRSPLRTQTALRWPRMYPFSAWKRVLQVS